MRHRTPPLLALLLSGCLSSGSDSPNAPDACRSQCELAAGQCHEIDFDDFPDEESTLADWRQDCGSMRAFVATGTCDGDRRFVYRHGGYTSEVRYFDDGEFVGLATTTDAIDSTCQGSSYFPEPTACGVPVIDEVICGDRAAAGDTFELPWADGSGKPPDRSATVATDEMVGAENGDGDGDGDGVDPTSCAQPIEGCPCEVGTEPQWCDPAEVASMTTMQDGVSGMLVCTEATRYCRSGSWSACEAIGWTFVPG